MDIDIRIEEKGVDLHFGTLSELQQWIEREEKFWNWLEKVPPQHELQFLLSLPTKYWNITRRHIIKYEGEVENARENIVRDIIDAIRTIYSQNHAILSTSPKAQFIETLRHKSFEVAAFALCSFLRPNEIPSNAPPAIRGIMQAYLFDLGLSTDTASAEKEALRLLSENWSSIIQTAGKQQSEYERMSKDAVAQFSKLRNEELAQCEHIRKEATDQFKALEHTFREKLALLAPVTYWKEKATKHRNVSIAVGIAFVAMGAVTAWLVWLALQHFVIAQVSLSSKASDSPIQPEYWRYTIPVAIGTFLVWPMRILARMLLSNLHLREDAMERVTMANTYLAFSEAKAGLKEEDRKLILEMLFRPSSTGIVYDDAAPPSIFAYLSKAGSGKH